MITAASDSFGCYGTHRLQDLEHPITKSAPFNTYGRN